MDKSSKDDDDNEDLVITKKDLEAYEQKIIERLTQNAQSTRQAQEYIQENIDESNEVRGNYANKVSKALDSIGIKLNENPSLQASADILWKQMHMEEAIRLGRPLHMPVLTGKETQELAQKHWQAFSQIYLSGQSLPKTKATTTSLSAGASAVTTGKSDQLAPDEIKSFMEKKAAGKVTPLEALKLYNKKK